MKCCKYPVEKSFYLLHQDTKIELSFTGSLPLWNLLKRAMGREQQLIWLTSFRVMFEVAIRQGVCVCLNVCICAWCSAAITCSLAQSRVPAMSVALCKHWKFLSFRRPLFFLNQWSLRDSQSDTVLFDWHVGEVMLDVATSDDDNDWPWGNDLLRQGERKKGARR